MQQKYSDEQLRLAAQLYYVDRVGQAEVAKFVRVSQAKVSRLLAAARERGIVRISVAEYNPRNSELEERVRREFGLRAVAVIKTISGAAGEDARRTVGHFGSAFVSPLFAPNSIVAIAGGRTVREVVQLLPEDKERHLTVVQAMGSIDSQISPVDAFELGRAMARRYDGLFLALNTPAFVPDKKTRDSFLALEQIKSVWRRFGQADAALVGIGTLQNSVFVDRGVLTPADLEQLRRRGAVGEICGRFFDEAGRECDTSWHERVMGIEIESLRRIAQVIAVVAGPDRAAAITAAIRGGLVKSLLTDESGAAALLEHRRSAAAAKPERAKKRPAAR